MTGAPRVAPQLPRSDLAVAIRQSEIEQHEVESACRQRLRQDRSGLVQRGRRHDTVVLDL